MSPDETTSPGGPTDPPPPEPNHARRIAAICVLAAVATPVVVLVWGPHLPPGDATIQAQHQQAINTILAGIVTPVVLGIVYAIYVLIVFRDRGGTDADGPPIRGDRRITTAWIAVTSAVVVFVVSYGTYDWIGPGVGVGSGQGPDRSRAPKGRSRSRSK